MHVDLENHHELIIHIKQDSYYSTVFPCISVNHLDNTVISSLIVSLYVHSDTLVNNRILFYPMQYGRCLIPANWYFEWEQSGTAKIKHAIRTLEPVLYLAGLSRQERDGQLRFVILTRPACASIRYIHERMPVIFPPALHIPWLHGNTPVRLLAYAETVVEEEAIV